MNNQSITPVSVKSEIKDTEFESIFSKYDHLRIATDKPIEPSPAIITIGDSTISTVGGLTVISGPSKAGKSALINIILAGAIRQPGNSYDDISPFHIMENDSKKAVLHFDTEQTRHQHFKGLSNSILKRLGITKEPDHLLSYNIRELSVTEYIKVVSDLFKASYTKYGGIHLAVIDGIADFIKSVNDEEASNKVIHDFEKLAVQYNTTILLVIHLNPGSEKQRGHLGSQLQRKAESVLAVKKDGADSFIEPQLLRNADKNDIIQIRFRFDKFKNYHVSAGVSIIPNKETVANNELKDLAKKVFESGSLSYKDSVKNIMNATGLSDRQSKSKIKEMYANGFIRKYNKTYILSASLKSEKINQEIPFQI